MQRCYKQLYANFYVLHNLNIFKLYKNRQVPIQKENSAKLKQVEILILIRDFPSGPVVESLPFNAGDRGSIPGQETKIPYASG